MRRAARVDENQAEIVAALRQIGASVQSLASVGCGCPDLLIGLRGRNCLLEIKNPKQDASHRRLTPDEEGFLKCWRGQYAVVMTVEQAIREVTK